MEFILTKLFEIFKQMLAKYYSNETMDVQFILNYLEHQVLSNKNTLLALLLILTFILNYLFGKFQSFNNDVVNAKTAKTVLSYSETGVNCAMKSSFVPPPAKAYLAVGKV